MIPLKADMDRVTPEGHVRVYETRDAGETWAPRGDGLPAEHAYLTVLREAFDRRGEGEALELYFGATSGDVFGSPDAGATWFSAATHLPPVYSVRTSLEVAAGSRAGAACRVSSGTMIRRMLHSGCSLSSLSASWNAAR